MLCDLSFYRIITITQDISVFETISKLYLYLVMITDSYHIPVIGNNIVIYYSGFYVYMLKLEGICFFVYLYFYTYYRDPKLRHQSLVMITNQ